MVKQANECTNKLMDKLLNKRMTKLLEQPMNQGNFTLLSFQNGKSLNFPIGLIERTQKDLSNKTNQNPVAPLV